MTNKKFIVLASAALLLIGAGFAQACVDCSVGDIRLTGTWNITCGHVGPDSSHIMGNGQAIFYEDGRIVIWQKNVYIQKDGDLIRLVKDGNIVGADVPAVTIGTYEVDSQRVGVIYGGGEPGQFPPKDSDESYSFIVTMEDDNRSQTINLAIPINAQNFGIVDKPWYFLCDNPAYLMSKDTPEIP